MYIGPVMGLDTGLLQRTDGTVIFGGCVTEVGQHRAFEFLQAILHRGQQIVDGLRQLIAIKARGVDDQRAINLAHVRHERHEQQAGLIGEHLPLGDGHGVCADGTIAVVQRRRCFHLLILEQMYQIVFVRNVRILRFALLVLVAHSLVGQVMQQVFSDSLLQLFLAVVDQLAVGIVSRKQDAGIVGRMAPLNLPFRGGVVLDGVLRMVLIETLPEVQLLERSIGIGLKGSMQVGGDIADGKRSVRQHQIAGDVGRVRAVALHMPHDLRNVQENAGACAAGDACTDHHLQPSGNVRNFVGSEDALDGAVDAVVHAAVAAAEAEARGLADAAGAGAALDGAELRIKPRGFVGLQRGTVFEQRAKAVYMQVNKLVLAEPGGLIIVRVNGQVSGALGAIQGRAVASLVQLVAAAEHFLDFTQNADARAAQADDQQR